MIMASIKKQYSMIHKIFYIILIFSIYSCKEEATKTVEKNIQVRNTSFVHSCGSGCALTYKEINLTKVNSNFQAKLNITMHINEKKSDEYSETYTIECKNKSVKSVTINGDNENIILNDINGVSDAFKNYANGICCCHN